MSEEDLRKFFKETFEFYSTLRTSERERFEIMQQFMVKSSEILKELADNIKNAISEMDRKIEMFQRILLEGLESIKDTLSITYLEKTNEILQDIVDKLQRQSYLFEYKHTVSELKEMLSNLVGKTNNVRELRSSPKSEQENVSRQPQVTPHKTIKETPSIPQKTISEPMGPKIKSTYQPPSPKVTQPTSTSQKASNDNEYLPTFMRLEKSQPSEPVVSSTPVKKSPQTPKRLVELKPPPPKEENNKTK